MLLLVGQQVRLSGVGLPAATHRDNPAAPHLSEVVQHDEEVVWCKRRQSVGVVLQGEQVDGPHLKQHEPSMTSSSALVETNWWRVIVGAQCMHSKGVHMCV